VGAKFQAQTPSSRKALRTLSAFAWTDGKTYTISHPDFGAVAENALIVLNGPGHKLGNANFVICHFDQIARVQQLKSKAQAA